jgi:hypothetical protein
MRVLSHTQLEFSSTWNVLPSLQRTLHARLDFLDNHYVNRNLCVRPSKDPNEIPSDDQLPYTANCFNSLEDLQMSSFKIEQLGFGSTNPYRP